MSTLNRFDGRGTATWGAARRSSGRRRSASTKAKKVRAHSPILKVAAGAGRVLMALTLAAAVLLFLFLGIGPRFLNYQTSTMLTGSMAPMINAGDVVVSVRIPVSELQVGDVITYSIPVDDHKIETHRVTSIERDAAGATSVITKGDANQGADPWVAILDEDYIYKTAGVVPYLGTGIRALREPPVQAALLYGAPALVVVILLKSIWAKPREESGPPAASAVASEPESVRS